MVFWGSFFSLPDVLWICWVRVYLWSACYTPPLPELTNAILIHTHFLSTMFYSFGWQKPQWRYSAIERFDAGARPSDRSSLWFHAEWEMGMAERKLSKWLKKHCRVPNTSHRPFQSSGTSREKIQILIDLWFLCFLRCLVENRLNQNRFTIFRHKKLNEIYVLIFNPFSFGSILLLFFSVEIWTSALLFFFSGHFLTQLSLWYLCRLGFCIAGCGPRWQLA